MIHSLYIQTYGEYEISLYLGHPVLHVMMQKQLYGEYEISLYIGHPVLHVMMQKQLYGCRNVGDGKDQCDSCCKEKDIQVKSF